MSIRSGEAAMTANAWEQTFKFKQASHLTRNRHITFLLDKKRHNYTTSNIKDRGGLDIHPKPDIHAKLDLQDYELSGLQSLREREREREKKRTAISEH